MRAILFPTRCLEVHRLDGTVGFFAKAGFHPPELWVCSAAFFETVAAVSLVLGIYTRWTALLGAFLLFVAVAALLKVGGFKWLWNLGGFEYPVFWALACMTVALNAWKDARVSTRAPIPIAA